MQTFCTVVRFCAQQTSLLGTLVHQDGERGVAVIEFNVILTLTAVIDVSGYCDSEIRCFAFAECSPIRVTLPLFFPSFFLLSTAFATLGVFSSISRSIMKQSLEKHLSQIEST